MSSRQKRSKLILHLSKPWEVGEALGWSPLPATVDRCDADRWLVELERPFSFGQSEYRYFVVAPRLEGWRLEEADATEVPCRIVPIGPDPSGLARIDKAAIEQTEMTGSVTDYRH